MKMVDYMLIALFVVAILVDIAVHLPCNATAAHLIGGACP